MAESKTNYRWKLYDAAIEAGRHQEVPLPFFWPKLAPLTRDERVLVRNFLAAEEREGITYELPSEAAERPLAVEVHDGPQD